jgi:starch phosphorylase
MPLFYGNRTGLIDIVRHAIALNGLYFTAQRMLQEYLIKANSQ